MSVPAEASPPLLPVVYEFTAEADATAWKVQRIDLNEQLSRPYYAIIQLTTEDLTAAVDTLVGSPCVLSVKRGDSERRLCGMALRVERLGSGTHELQVRVHVGPALSLLAQRVVSRIFQEQKTPDIAKQVLEKALKPFKCDVKLNLSRSTYVTREYCVQYNESDLAFLHRLLEEEGIMYAFDHSGEREAIILFDKNDALGPVQTLDGAAVPVAAGLEVGAHAESVRRFTWSHELTSSKVDMLEYDWTRPSAPGSASSAVSDQAIELPIFEHWESERTKAAGNLKHLAAVVDGGWAARQRRGLGEGVVSGFTPGLTFELHGHGVSELDQKYLITRVHHQGEAPEALTDESARGSDDDRDDDAEGRPERYENDFECIPLSQAFIPPQVTAQPRIHSLMTATVVGPGGEEIHVDEHGRIKVQFHWDRTGKNDDKSSCWIRVSQPWAHAGWGTWFVPRIGMEVLVAFVEGDPDKPLVVGSVYNGHNPTPFPLPDSKTKSGIRTNSSPGGGGFNEISFDDTAGAEMVFHQAQKDLTIEVKNDKQQHVGRHETLHVDGNRDREVGGDQTLKVKKNDSSAIDGNQNLQVGGNRDSIIGGNLTESIGASHSETVATAFTLTVGAAANIAVGGAMAEQVGAAKNETVGGVKSEQVGGQKTVMVGGGLTEQIGGDVKLTVGKDWTVKVMGAAKLEVTKDQSLVVKGKMQTAVEKDFAIKAQKLVVEGKDEMALKVGSSQIILKADGVTIKGSKITIQASGDVILKGSKIAGN